MRKWANSKNTIFFFKKKSSLKGISDNFFLRISLDLKVFPQFLETLTKQDSQGKILEMDKIPRYLKEINYRGSNNSSQTVLNYLRLQSSFLSNPISSIMIFRISLRISVRLRIIRPRILKSHREILETRI